MIILGIDPSLNSLGFAVISGQKDGSIKLLEKGTIKPNNSKELYHEKLRNIHHQISIVFQKYKPQTLAIEDTFVNVNPSTSLKLGVVRGVCIGLGIENNAKIEEYSPKEVKKALTGKGGSEKAQLGYMLNTILPHNNAANNDESDAMAVCITSLFMQGIGG